MALLMMHADATVTICHSKTPDLPGVARRRHSRSRDRQARFVDDTFVKPGAVVIDVGTNRVESGREGPRGLREMRSGWRTSRRRVTR